MQGRHDGGVSGEVYPGRWQFGAPKSLKICNFFRKKKIIFFLEQSASRPGRPSQFWFFYIKKRWGYPLFSKFVSTFESTFFA